MARGKFRAPYSGEKGPHGEALLTEDTRLDRQGNYKGGSVQDPYGYSDPSPERDTHGKGIFTGSGPLPKGRRR